MNRHDGEPQFSDIEFVDDPQSTENLDEAQSSFVPSQRIKSLVERIPTYVKVLSVAAVGFAACALVQSSTTSKSPDDYSNPFDIKSPVKHSGQPHHNSYNYRGLTAQLVASNATELQGRLQQAFDTNTTVHSIEIAPGVIRVPAHSNSKIQIFKNPVVLDGTMKTAVNGEVGSATSGDPGIASLSNYGMETDGSVDPTILGGTHALFTPTNPHKRIIVVDARLRFLYEKQGNFHAQLVAYDPKSHDMLHEPNGKPLVIGQHSA